MNEPKTKKILCKKEQDQVMDYEDEPKINNKSATNSTENEIRATNHETTIQNLLPEVLEAIFHRVDCSKDLLSCWNTSLAWNKVLSTNEFYLKMVLPFILPHLNRKNLLSCSNVSKFWNKAVDTSIQEILPEDFGSGIDTDLELQNALTLHVGNMPSFLNAVTRVMIEGPPQQRGILPVANPVTFRRLQFMIWLHQGMQPANPRTLYTFESRCLLMCLYHHGSHIRHLHLDMSEDIVSYLEKLKLIQSCLKQTPNLRVLWLTVSKHRGNDETTDELKAFHEHMSENPWPPLEHLKMLTFEDRMSHPEFAPITNAYGPNLHFLQFGSNLMEPYQMVPTRFSCLQKLVYICKDASSGVKLREFLQTNKCPLKELTITIKFEQDEANYDALTSAANAASDTLEILRLNYYEGGCSREYNLDVDKFKGLKLPKLKVLKLNTFLFPSLEFLKKVCPAIQTLVVTPQFPVWRNNIPPGVIKHVEMYVDLYSQHQFWEGLADIQNVDVKYLECYNNPGETDQNRRSEVKRKVFTRYDYEARK